MIPFLNIIIFIEINKIKKEENEEKTKKENINQEKLKKEENNQVLNPSTTPEEITQEIKKVNSIEQKNNENLKPIQLVLSKNGILETTTEAINTLTGLKKEKLCIISINGPCEIGKSKLANNIIENVTGFKTSIKTEGIWLWNYPIILNNGNRLLVLDCQGLDINDKISHKLFILSTLLSTCMIYYTEGEINENIINQFNYFVELLKEIKINKDKNDELNELKNYFPELIFVNNIIPSEPMQKLLEEKNENIIKLFEKRSYLNIKEKNIMEIKLKMEQMKSKEIQNINIDGDSLFCLLQNYIDFINSDKPLIINLAFENAVL